MEDVELKTSLKQRIIICAIAILMLGATIASYVAIVVSGSNSGSSSTSEGLSEERIAYYDEMYGEAVEAFQGASMGDFAKFSEYLSAVGTYDEETAENGGLAKKELLVGDGRELAAEDTDYLAYYVGWCADGSVFDSSLDSAESPTKFAGVLNAKSAGSGLITGWTEGVIGMRLGGVRRVTMPSEMAYGDSREICGGYNKPLRFLIMAVANEGTVGEAAEALDTALMKLQYAYYGIDYEEQFGEQ